MCLKWLIKLLIFTLFIFNILTKVAAYHQNNNIKRSISELSHFCILPPHPNFGRWEQLRTPNASLQPGMTVSSETILQVQCDDGYHLNGDKLLLCQNSEWSDIVGLCLKTCPSILSTNVLRVTCINGHLRTSCATPVEGTVAEFICADFYEDYSLKFLPPTVCLNGSWTYNVPRCQPKCGQKTVANPALIVNGGKTVQGEYPWQIAIYNGSILICGGTLISSRVVLTAAHCIADERGDFYSSNYYTIAAGKYYRNINDTRDKNEAQFLLVYKMFIPDSFKGLSQNYLGDIGIIITDRSFSYSSRVLPACIDWNRRYEHVLTNPPRKTFGYVSGWGFTKESAYPSEELKQLKVPIVSRKKCTKTIPEDYENFLTHDKFCAGYLNSNKSVCRGDSGGGIAFKVGQRFYLMGIVSIAPQSPSAEGGCDSTQYGFYTKVSHYIDSLILEKITLYGQSAATTKQTFTGKTTSIISSALNSTASSIQKSCRVPKDSTYKFSFNARPIRPGALFHERGEINVDCIDGYKLLGNNVISCIDGLWDYEAGQCSQMCPTLVNDSSIKVSCSSQFQYSGPCNDATEGTIATMRCRDIEIVQSSICTKGQWTESPPICELTCGQHVSNSELNKAFPWHVGLYENREFVCGGTLISSKVVLTAGGCIVDITLNRPHLKNERDFRVVAGSLYKNAFNISDRKGVQDTAVQRFVVHSELSRKSDNGTYYTSDIGIVITMEHFGFTSTVNPICIDWASKYDEASVNPFRSRNKQIGYVSAWQEEGLNSLQKLKISTPNVSTCHTFDFSNGKLFLIIKCGYFDSKQCMASRGEGLVFKLNDRYHLFGIAGYQDMEERKTNCAAGKLEFTEVFPYIDFISERQKIADYYTFSMF